MYQADAQECRNLCRTLSDKHPGYGETPVTARMPLIAPAQAEAISMSSSPETNSDSHIQEEDYSPENSGDISPALPQYTRVVIVGNNRTKRALVGQKALVKKSVGLGGWHLLVRRSRSACMHA